MSDSFFARVYALLARVPRGRVVTYGEVARMLGRPSGAQAVGWAMRHCPEGYPWQRVINAQGRPSTTERLPDGKLLQQALLEEEGVVFDASGCLDLNLYGWRGTGDG